MKKTLASEEQDDANNTNIPSDNWKENFICISYMNRFEIINVEELLSCNAQGRCTEFKLIDGRRLISSKNLSEYDSFFELHNSFVKVSRSCVINFKFLKTVIKTDGMQCILADGTAIAVARRKYSEVIKLLNLLGKSTI
jgi:two-component system LytT family response regulator